MRTCADCGHESEERFTFCPGCGAKWTRADAEDLIGQTLNGKYRVVEQIGAGSMGRVYLGEHLGLQKRVALKILHDDLQVGEESLRRFQREGIAAGKFTHPNAIDVFDFDRDERGRFFLAMEYVDGTSLREFLRDLDRVSSRVAVDLILQVLGCLEEAHRHGIVHRDLKPDNIMVSASSSGALTVKVLDFGLSKLADRPVGASLLTQVGRIIGTPLYMAPEQWAGAEIDHRTDLYASGLVLFELLTGEAPFRGENISQTMLKSTTQPAPSIVESYPDLRMPSELDAILAKALAKQPDERYQSAREMIDALERVDHGATAQPRRRARSAPAPRRRVWLAAGAIVALVAGIAAIAFASSNDESADATPAVRLIRDKASDRRSDDEKRYLALLDQARDELRADKSILALRTLEDAKRLGLDDPEVHVVRAAVHRRRGDDEAAILDYEEALAREPGYAEAAAGIGWIHLDRGELDDAEARFVEAATLDDRNADALAGQAAVHLASGNTLMADELLARAAELDSSSVRVQHLRGEALLEMGDPDGAVEAFLNAKRTDMTFWPAIASLGRCYIEAGRVAEGIQQLRDAIELNPDAIEPRTHLATALIDDGKTGEAQRTIDDGLTRHPDHGPWYVLRGVALLGGDRDAAVAALEQGIARAPDDPQAHVLLGQLHHRQQRYEQAAEQYGLAIAADDGNATAHLDLGLALFSLGRIQEARASLETAVALDPDVAYAHYALGVLFMDYFADPRKALWHLEEYTALGGDDARVPGWIERLK